MIPEAGVSLGAEPALEVVHLSKTYGRIRALDDVSFTVRQGGVTALLGLNGAGKTTLFQILTGLFGADGGQVRMFGRDFARSPTAALARMGVVFQQPVLDLDLSVFQNLHFYAGLHGFRASVAAAAIETALERFSIGNLAPDRVRTLSGGTRRKVEVARAFLASPDLLLLDEPSTGLDAQSRRDLARDVFGLAAERNMAVLWATHLVHEVDGAGEVIILHQGRVAALGSPESLMARSGAGTLEQAFLTIVGAPAP